MLVLSRKAREQIQIGDEVVVTILQVKGQSVRIGIEAPRNVRVLRSELPKFDSLDSESVDGDTSKVPTEKTKVRTTRGTSRIAHPGEGSAAPQSPPLSGRLDARRTPRIKSFEVVHSPQRSELTALRFDTAVRSTSFPG
jgi:carbon storage regulator CsrA